LGETRGGSGFLFQVGAPRASGGAVRLTPLAHLRAPVAVDYPEIRAAPTNLQNDGGPVFVVGNAIILRDQTECSFRLLVGLFTPRSARRGGPDHPIRGGPFLPIFDTLALRDVGK